MPADPAPMMMTVRIIAFSASTVCSWRYSNIIRMPAAIIPHTAAAPTSPLRWAWRKATGDPAPVRPGVGIPNQAVNRIFNSSAWAVASICAADDQNPPAAAPAAEPAAPHTVLTTGRLHGSIRRPPTR